MLPTTPAQASKKNHGTGLLICSRKKEKKEKKKSLLSGGGRKPLVCPPATTTATLVSSVCVWCSLTDACCSKLSSDKLHLET